MYPLHRHHLFIAGKIKRRDLIGVQLFIVIYKTRIRLSCEEHSKEPRDILYL